MRTPLTLALALLLLVPGTLAGAPAAPLTAEPLAGAALADAAALGALATSLTQMTGAADVAALTGAEALALPELSFDDALAALYAQAGLDLPATYARPEPALAQELAPLVFAAATSARLTEEAFAGLDAQERAFLLANYDAALVPTRDPAAAETAARVQALAARVDMPAMAMGAATLAAAAEAFTAPTGATTSWSDPNGLLEVGSTGSDAYCTERVLIIDLGGNDLYDCHPASYAPGSTLPVPVSVVLDLGGNDMYSTTALHASSPTATWGQGVGIAGVGLLVDRWGDDSYQVNIWDQATWCAHDFWTGAPQTVYGQGVGALGVGAVLDAGGNDGYYVVDINMIANSCHFGWVYAFAQGAGLLGGAGLLVDDTGDDWYYTTSYALGKADNIAAVYAQAVSAGGVGALVDKEGSDSYFTQALSEITFGYTKGAFAYVFSQASVTATNQQPTPDPAALLGVAVAQVDAGNLCPSLNREGAGAGLAQGSCDGAGLALLVDVLGDDTFRAHAWTDDYRRGCYNGLWSVVSAQGSAAWSGAAALINIDVEGLDAFDIQTSARGDYCGYPATRAHSYGQGYAGPVLWNFWDLPGPAGVEQHPIGILASLGVPEETCPGRVRPDGGLPVDDIIAPLGVVPRDPLDAIALPALPQPSDPCKATAGVPHLAASPDSYTANAFADNPRSTADAQTWAQGSSLGSLTVPAYSMATYPARGVALHLDVGGDDLYQADAAATGVSPNALVSGQGATRDSVAALANVGGADQYAADARHNGVSVPANTLVQGYADALGTTTVGPLCVSPSLLTLCLNPVTLATSGGIALFIEVFGYDKYSEAVERTGCHTNGALLGTWPVGVVLGTAWWGHVLGHPCSTPATDTGSGTVIGLDWWSDAY